MLLPPDICFLYALYIYINLLNFSLSVNDIAGERMKLKQSCKFRLPCWFNNSKLESIYETCFQVRDVTENSRKLLSDFELSGV